VVATLRSLYCGLARPRQLGGERRVDGAHRGGERAQRGAQLRRRRCRQPGERDSGTCQDAHVPHCVVDLTGGRIDCLDPAEPPPSSAIRDLGYRVDRLYLGTNYSVVNAHWKFRRDNAILAPNVADDLRDAMTKNPYLRVFSANGYYDLATPFFGTEYTLGHLALAPALRSHVEYGFYPSGHMIYLNDESRRSLKTDLVRFYREAAGR